MSSDNPTVSRLLKDMEAHFETGKEERAEVAGTGIPASEGSNPSRSGPSVLPRPAFRLHEYKREPKKLEQVVKKLREQGGVCAWSKPDHDACGGVFFEQDHIDGDPKNPDWENLQVLCEHHHRTKTNLDRKVGRHPMSVRVQNAPIHYPTSDASLEDIKHDNWAAKFAPWIRNLAEGPFRAIGNVISYPALVGLTMDAVAYVDQWGNEHIPTESTAQRYIREECIRPKGCLQFCTRNGMRAVEFVGDGGKSKKPSLDIPQAHIVSEESA